MKVLFTIGFLLFRMMVLAQADSIFLKEAMLKLDKALLERDHASLQEVLHQDLQFGHSNGWVQRKEDVLSDFKSGKLLYKKIEHIGTGIVNINKKRATVMTKTQAGGTVNAVEFALTLHVMQVWLKTKKGWQLMARQSTKI